MKGCMPLALKLALIALVTTAGIWDLRTRKIPNWLNLSGVVLGVGLNMLVSQGAGLKQSLLGLGLALLVYLPLFSIRAMGAGDAKLMAAVGSIAGPHDWLIIFLLTAIFGGIASLAVVLTKGRVLVTLQNLGTITNELLHARAPYIKDPSLDVHDKRSVGLPHGAVIAVGSLTLVLLVV
jgi:prepilin peptidase CpaA